MVAVTGWKPNVSCPSLLSKAVNNGQSCVSVTKSKWFWMIFQTESGKPSIRHKSFQVLPFPNSRFSNLPFAVDIQNYMTFLDQKFCSVLFCQTGYSYAVQAASQLLTFPPRPPPQWDYRHTTPCPPQIQSLKCKSKRERPFFCLNKKQQFRKQSDSRGW